MARRPILEIDGVKYDKVYKVSWELYTAKDETGRPSDCAHAGTIKITRESDGNTDIARWAMDSSEPNWKSGNVTFKNPDDSEMKVLEWRSGFVTKYIETVPHIKDDPSDQVFEYFEVSCAWLKVGDAEIGNRWELAT
jgi:hypothetical protein